MEKYRECGTEITIRNKVTTPERLKELIDETGLSHKDFCAVFNAWLKEKKREGKYLEQPDLTNPHISRWIKWDGVKMRPDKIKMFSDYFNIDPEYLACTSPEKQKRDVIIEIFDVEITDEQKDEFADEAIRYIKYLLNELRGSNSNQYAIRKEIRK